MLSMMALAMVVFPDAVPPATPMIKGFLFMEDMVAQPAGRVKNRPAALPADPGPGNNFRKKYFFYD